MSSTMSLTSMEVSPRPDKKPGYVILKKSRIFCLLFLALIVVVIVGILSGVFSAKKERQLVKAEYEKQTGTKVIALSTAAPSTQPTHTTKPQTTRLKVSTAAPSTQPAPTTKPETTPAKTGEPQTTPAKTEKPELWHNVRLPDNVIPEHYELTLQPFIKNLTFHGVQKAYVTVTSPTKYVIIHIKEMTVQKAKLEKLVTGSTQAVGIKRAFDYKENEYHVVEADKELSVGKYVLTLNYQAKVSKALTGFYKSTYKTKNETRTLLTTKFQPTDARKAFPCFDEPNLKATFTIIVLHEGGYHAMSNMPAKLEKLSGGWWKTTFNKTVRMSTYLVCFIVSDFLGKQATTGKYNNITLGVYSSPPHVQSTDFALKVGNNMTRFFESFFKVLYPMPKLDMVAIPDYGSGATEHWGVITYRQARLLVTDGISSESNRQSSATIIAHELAHLWFGNLVTCKWWNDLWVQEGMASYTEYYGVHEAKPDWEMMEQFIGADWKTGMELDALSSSHPIIVGVEHPKQIKEIFDSITYNKGSSIIRMLDDYLGLETFRNGLAVYLTKNQFSGATSADLWNAMSEASGKDVNAIMDTWTLQMGYPVVTVTRKSKTEAQVIQKHFLLDPNAKVTQASPFNYKWAVPFTFIISNKPGDRKVDLVNDTSKVLKNIDWPDDAWIKGNYMTKGFYRVNYDATNWQRLITQLKTKHEILSASDRAGLIDDAFALARANLLGYETALSTTQYLANEESYVVWKLAIRNLGYINKVLKARESYGRFRSYMVKRLKPMVKKLGWKSDGTHIEKYKRSLFLWAACGYGDQESLTEASRLFNEWMVNKKTIDVELRSLVLYYGVANGGVKEWEYVFDQYMKETDPTTKGKLQYALSATQQPWILNKWLGYTMVNTTVRSQDTVYVISDVAANPVGKYVAWDFSRANWDKLMVIASANNFHVTKLTLGITQQFTTKFELDQMNEFWKQNPKAGAGARARVQAAERIQASIDWIDKYAVTVENWLKMQKL